MDRRLAAILAADVVGYAKLMGADEAGALAAVDALHRRTVVPLVQAHAGQVIKRTGDGWLVEFNAALDAVTCAIAIQESTRAEHEIALRIGVHLGDVIHDDEGDIHGDGVNVAARLEGIAASGGIAISDQVYNALDGTRTPLFTGGSPHTLKNIARQVGVWDWVEAATPRQASGTAGRDEVPMILLEPFTLGGDLDMASDIALDIQSGLEDALAHRSGIRVATVAESPAGGTYRLHGRCRVSGTRCRLHLSISVVATGETCWTTKIDGETADTFAFVDEVVWKVGTAIRVQINAFNGVALADAPDDSLTVQQLLSKAAYFLNRHDTESKTKAKETLAVAYARGPENPMVLSLYSYSLMQFVPLAMQTLTEAEVAEVISFADKAIHFGPEVDYAFHNRARIRLWLRGDLAGCIKDARRADAINPGFHFATEDIAMAHIFGDRPADGVKDLETLVREFPTHPTTPLRLSILALGYFALGNADVALGHAIDAYERRPTDRVHGIVYAAVAAGQAAHTDRPDFRRMIERLEVRISDADRFPFAAPDRRAALADALRAAGAPA